MENSGQSRLGKQICLGYYKETTVYKLDNQSVIIKPRLLLDDLKPGEDEGKVSWYPEPHMFVNLMKRGTKKLRGFQKCRLFA